MAAQFKAGGKVVCIRSATIGGNHLEAPVIIEKNETYTIEDVKTCSCGSVSLHIGFVRKSVPGFIQNNACCNCRLKTPTLIVWIHSRYFIHLEETEFKEVTYTKILEEIPQAAN